MDVLSGQQPHQPPEQALQIPEPLVQRQVQALRISRRPAVRSTFQC